MPASAAGTRRWTGLRGITFAISLAIAVAALSSAGTASAQPEIAGYLDDGRPIYRELLGFPKIEDPNGFFVPNIVTANPNHIKYETGHGSVILSKQYCSFAFYRPGTIEDPNGWLFVDSIVPKISVNGSGVFSSIPSIDSAACSISVGNNELVLTKYVANVGELKYKYVDTGFEWKTELEATNLSNLTNRQFGFTQSIDLYHDTVHFANQTRNLQNFNGTTFNHAWLAEREASVVDLLNGMNFDLDLGFGSLEKVTVYAYDTGRGKLVFDYFRDAPILLPGQTLVIDPTYSQSGTDYFARSNDVAGAACSAAGTFGATGNTVALDASGSVGPCRVTAREFNVTSIPFGADLYSGTLYYNVSSASSALNCNINGMTTYPSVIASFTNMWNNITQGTEYRHNTNTCVTNGQYSFALNSTVLQDIQNKLDGGMPAIGIGWEYVTQVRDATSRSNAINGSTLELLYLMPNPPWAVDDLTASNIQGDSLDLSWTEPDLQGNDLIGYRINYTTPCGDPTTILLNDSGTSTTSYTVSGLSETTCYSFRVTAITLAGKNATGNIENATTTIIFPNFTIGDINVNATNPSITPIRFERTDNNSTMTTLKVIYDNAYDMACQFSYTFEQDSDTYMNLTEEVYDADHNSTDFIFLDPSNDIINARCWDQTTNDTGRYVLAFSQFPLLDQIDNFRNGTYGTMGMFGALDFITVAVIIFSMIGFNRVNEAAGAFFNVSLLAALAYFGIIELPTIIFGGIAVIVMFAIASTRKD